MQAWIEEAISIEARDIVVNLPPMLGDDSAAALAICDLAVVPVSPSGADINAINLAVKLIEEARKERWHGTTRATPSKVERRGS